MMEVERHVSKLGRAALVKEVRKKIKNWILSIFIISLSRLPAG